MLPLLMMAPALRGMVRMAVMSTRIRMQMAMIASSKSGSRKLDRARRDLAIRRTTSLPWQGSYVAGHSGPLAEEPGRRPGGGGGIHRVTRRVQLDCGSAALGLLLGRRSPTTSAS